ncbi:TVP38/TMEM64 family protein [Pseudonocardia humida]|uniref:TVP38/TMEM64 family membrane protein n=1 Tax=Pseudonocardia humida TaxID=2800819 RepID=A0ABT0ZS46_9PSEU|nr:TVP38/TMEM64 family protein [Pseudonocardia humida]MCO1653538.1 TVP38/TMEM64 family protein [Pseudonocardia humida]
MARWARPALLVVLVVAGAVLALTVGVPPLSEIQAWVRSAGWAGPVLYAAIAALASLTPGPATMLTVGSGVLFGWPGGVPVALTASLTSALVNFTMARLLGRSTVQGLAGDRLERLDAALRRRGVLAVIGIRLVPMAPFAIVNAACGLSGVRVRDYVLGSAFGLLPGTVTFVAVGAFGTSPGSLPFLVSLGALGVLVGGAALAARRGLVIAARVDRPGRPAGATAIIQPAAVEAAVDSAPGTAHIADHRE